MGFVQSPPALSNTFRGDPALRGLLEDTLPEGVWRTTKAEFEQMGELASRELYDLGIADRLNEPNWTAFDPWGNRVDRVEVTSLWKRCQVVAAERGLVAHAYEETFGEFSRVVQFALVHLFAPSSDVYTCPLAMTDGAAKTLSVHRGSAVSERAIQHLTSRDPKEMWTSGQWMTERTGGSDVGLTETRAVPARDGSGDYHLYGTKWFTSAVTAEMALTLARPEGNAAGGQGLALFYLEIDRHGERNGIAVRRLKDKLGTRKVPTAELDLDGTVATPVAGLTGGIRNIAPMLNVTRTWNAVCSVAFMARGIQLARDYATKRVQFGAKLIDKPLHLRTLAEMQASYEAALHLTFFVAGLLGREEQGSCAEGDAALLRMMTPLAKLWTAKLAVEVTSEAIECFGGAGYVEDTGLPTLVRDAHVLPIWEGTTNVLSLDFLRVIGKGEGARALEAVLTSQNDEDGGPAAEALAVGRARAQGALGWVRDAFGKAPETVEGAARHVALRVAEGTGLALLAKHAHRRAALGDKRPLAAAKLFAAMLEGGLGSLDAEAARLLTAVPA